ncbi:MAG: hypothetical protein K2H47_05830 [Muribaculaceae bacterium]|nr:hypothetical protein [Muribaculaceae bacterium]
MSEKTKTLTKALTSAIAEYLDQEEAYGDDAMLVIDPDTLTVDLIEEEPADAEASPLYYVRVMDLVRMDTEKPGRWLADSETVAELSRDILE